MPTSTRHKTATENDADLAQTEKELDALEGKGEDSPFYCPGCGLRYEYRQRCVGTPERPHQPIEVVSTDELATDTQTPAPNTD